MALDDPIRPKTPPRLSEAEIRQAIELLFFAYRDFTAEATPSSPDMDSAARTTG